MKKLIYLKICGACIAISVLFLGFACKTEEEKVKPAKEVRTYTLTKLNMANYDIAGDKLRAVVSSGDGKFVYLIGESAHTLKSLDVNASKDKDIRTEKWVDAAGKWKTLKKATDHTDEDRERYSVDSFSSTPDGIMFTLWEDPNHNGGLVVLKGTGENNTSYYPQGAANFKAGASNPFFVTDKMGAKYIYLFAAKTLVPAAFKREALFRKYVAPPTNDTAGNWTDIRKHFAKDLILARAQDPESNLLIADKDGIKRIKHEDIGKDKALDNKGKAIYEVKDFSMDGKTANHDINTMTLVDDKYLLVGFKSSSPENGGVVIADMTANPPKFEPLKDTMGHTVDSIAPRRTKDSKISAIIVTDKGLFFLDNDGKIMEPVKGEGHLITAKLMNANQPKKEYNEPKSGFTGDTVTEPIKEGYKGVAHDSKDRWYLITKGNTANDSGVYVMTVTHDELQAPTAPPEVP